MSPRIDSLDENSPASDPYLGVRGVTHGHVVEAVAVMRSDLAYPWTPQELGEAIHLSKAQLYRSFNMALGIRPIACLKLLRAERMADLLLTTDLSIAGVAKAVGWSDPGFAGRQFRQRYGVTPTGYRRRHPLPVEVKRDS